VNLAAALAAVAAGRPDRPLHDGLPTPEQIVRASVP
jgi:hypothetical protein